MSYRREEQQEEKIKEHNINEGRSGLQYYELSECHIALKDASELLSSDAEMKPCLKPGRAVVVRPRSLAWRSWAYGVISGETRLRSSRIGEYLRTRPWSWRSVSESRRR